MSVTEQSRDVSGRVRAHHPIGPPMLETHILQPVEIAQQFLPFRRDVCFAQNVIEMLLHREGQEGTKHMATDGGVRRMEVGRICRKFRVRAITMEKKETSYGETEATGYFRRAA